MKTNQSRNATYLRVGRVDRAWKQDSAAWTAKPHIKLAGESLARKLVRHSILEQHQHDVVNSSR